MSLLGLLGLGFGAGAAPSCDYPAVGNVRKGVVYADGSLTGTLFVPPAAVPVIFSGVTATQGFTPQMIIDALNNYLMTILELPQRRVVLWCQSGRCDIEGADVYIWFRFDGDVIDKSPGPVRYGNKDEIKFSVNLVTRNMRDGSQRDTLRIPPHFAYRWKLKESFQNLNLFNAYSAPPASPLPWTPPEPAAGAVPLTTGLMYLDPLAGVVRDQYEEGTIRTEFPLVIPTVLALSVSNEI